MPLKNLFSSSFFVYDRLYGHVPFTDDNLKLFQTPELARLRHVSLSAVPPWSMPAGECATKFEHSLGVAHLARVVGQKAEFKDVADTLFWAALLHDVGTPPFSHVTELLQTQLLGLNHEEFVESVLDGSELAKVIHQQGGSLSEIISFIKGEASPLSDVINSSLDVDNLDNTLRFGISMGLMTTALYNPEKLAQAFTFDEGQVALTQGCEDELKGWYKTRTEVYKFVNAPINSSPGMMLLRALSMAAEHSQIKSSFFTMTNSQALEYLRAACNPYTTELIKMMIAWNWFTLGYNLTTLNPSPKLQQHHHDLPFLNQLSNELATELKTSPHYVSIYIGKNKRFKQLHFPLISKNDQGQTEKKEFTVDAAGKPEWLVQVYTHPQLLNQKPLIEEFITATLEVT